MTLVGPVKASTRPRGLFIARIGTAAMVLAVILAILAWLLVSDLFRRFDATLEVSGEALGQVEATLEVADDALAALIISLEATSSATDQAAASAETVAAAVEETSRIVGNDVPEGIESIRDAMPGLIEASAVIDTTLSGLSLIGVPYDPEVPLDEAFRRLDRQLEPLPEELRQNAATIGELVPQAEGFRSQARLLSGQVGTIRASVEQARSIIQDYRLTADRVDELVASTRDGLARSELLAKVLVVIGAGVAFAVIWAVIVTGRAMARIEEVL